MEYIEISIHEPSAEKREILISLLATVDFESFGEEGDELLAYIRRDWYSRDKTGQICNMFDVTFTEKRIPEQNWNEEWEKNFEPVLIAESCYVRAPFHAPHPEFPLEIIIEPKMSFGTAHHETTSLMIEMMLQTDFGGKKVLDMGCGTGILAILAGKLGAVNVDAIDNDEWAYQNALENIQRNQVPVVKVKMGDVDVAGTGYDILLANINRNVLLGHIPEYFKCMEQGELLMSGFYEKDLEMIRQCAASHSFVFDQYLTKNQWVAARFIK